MVVILRGGSGLVSLVSRRCFSSGSSSRAKEVHPVFFKLKDTQKSFQIDNGLKIHERGGMKDKVLMYSTLGAGVVIVFEVFRYILEAGHFLKK